MSRSNRAEASARCGRAACALALLACVGAALALGACQRRSRSADPLADIGLKLTADPSPPIVGPTRLTFELTDASGAPAVAASLSVRADMTHAGMTPVMATSRETAPGSYLVEMEWPMAGDWVLTVEADLLDGRHLTRELGLTVEDAP